MQRLFVAMLVRVVQGGLFGVFAGMGGKAVSRVAVVSCFFVVTFFQVFSGRTVLLQGVLKVMRSFFVGLDNFLVLFGMVSHGESDIRLEK